jgi:hypothetical protein
MRAHTALLARGANGAICRECKGDGLPAPSVGVAAQTTPQMRPRILIPAVVGSGSEPVCDARTSPAYSGGTPRPRNSSEWVGERCRTRDQRACGPSPTARAVARPQGRASSPAPPPPPPSGREFRARPASPALIALPRAAPRWRGPHVTAKPELDKPPWYSETLTDLGVRPRRRPPVSPVHPSHSPTHPRMNDVLALSL